MTGLKYSFLFVIQNQKKSIEDSPDNIVEDNQKNQGFKNGDGDGDDDGEDGHQNDGYDGHDHVCAICDNGGDLLWCVLFHHLVICDFLF